MSKPERKMLEMVDSIGFILFGKNPQEIYEKGECLKCDATVIYENLSENRQKIYVDTVFCESCQESAEQAAEQAAEEAAEEA